MSSRICQLLKVNARITIFNVGQDASGVVVYITEYTVIFTAPEDISNVFPSSRDTDMIAEIKAYPKNQRDTVPTELYILGFYMP